MAEWNAYLIHWNPGAVLFERLRSYYATEIQRLAEPLPEDRPPRDPPERLAEHLMIMYYGGRIALDDALIRDFYEVAPDKLRGYALHFLGFSLYSDQGTVSAEVLARLRLLSEARIAVVGGASDGAAYKTELAAFGWWFASAKFDDGWSVSRLMEILNFGQRIEVAHLVVEHLGQLAKDRPAECVECIRLLCQNTDELAEIYGWQNQGRTVLSLAIASGAAAKSAAITLINRLEARGYSGFRDLLPASSAVN